MTYLGGGLNLSRFENIFSKIIYALVGKLDMRFVVVDEVEI